MGERVVITGAGAITPLGSSVETFWNNIKAGVSGIDQVSKFSTEGLPTRIAAEVKDFNPEDYVDRKDAKRMDRYTQFSMGATKGAIEAAQINMDDIDSERFGVILGVGIGGMETFEDNTRILLEKGPKRISPFFVPMMISNMAAGHISIEYNAKGPNMTVVTACASGTNAIGEAFKHIQRGAADIMITGGSEAAITPLSMAGFCSMKAMSTQNENPQTASKPFDKNRDGFIMGEGSAIMVIESLSHAQKRGAKILAEIVGYGLTADAYHITAPAPDGEGGARAMKAALDDAGITNEQIDYINAHGTSTPLNDKFETDGIKRVFGDYAYKLPISSTKSMTGHLLGAAGGLEALVCVLAMRDQYIPATINYEVKDDDCDLDYVPNVGRNSKLEYCLSNSFGFGGHNACLILKKFNTV